MDYGLGRFRNCSLLTGLHALVKSNFMAATNSRKMRLILVISGFVFALSLVAFAKLIGEGPIVPVIFVIGWLVLAAFVLRFFSRYKVRE